MEIVEEIKQALEYTKVKKYKNAENIYLKLLKLQPDNHSVLSFLGLLYFNLEKYDKAYKYLKKSYLILESDSIVKYLGVSCFNLRRYKETVIYLEKAIQNDKSVELYKALIKSYSQIENHKKLYEISDEAHKLFPFDNEILDELAFSALKYGKFAESEKYSYLYLKQCPTSPSAWLNIGLISEVLYFNPEKARECYKKVVKYGEKAAGYMHLAISYSKNISMRNRVLYYLNKVKKINPNKCGLSFLFAQYYLSKRQFKKGYKYYISPDIESQDDIDRMKNFEPRWLGGKYKNETLFVFGDQGLGDQMQFSRYLPFVSKYFKNVKVMVAESLIELLSRSFKSYKNITFYPRKKTYPKFDKAQMMAYLPYYLNKKFNNIPTSSGYLVPHEQKIKEYKSKYFSSDKLKIGICWEAGATGIHEQIHRSLNVEQFEKIINLKNSQIYSFQVKPSLDSYKKYSEIIDLGSTFNSFDDTAAALKNIDVLITVDTSIAHLAGALGVKTLLVLPYCSDWRWFDNTEKTEWYDSVTIFKQEEPADWNNVFEKIYLYFQS